MNLVSNSKGQMAIFLALIFQVLFIFFAMCINISLVVYDKINLQNSVDLASYYGASKQAEVLNVIAHINYQIRQNYKLLAWRYNHLGVASISNPKRHPIRDPISSRIKDLNDLESLGFFNSGIKADKRGRVISGVNSVCLSGPSIWSDSDRQENYCKDIGQKINVPGTNMLPDSNLFGIKSRFEGTIKKVIRSCGKIDFLNLWFVSHVLYARFLEDSRKKIRLIRTLVDRILIPFKDLEQNHISTGMRNVFENNLSYRNKRYRDTSSYQYMNSLQGQSFGSLFKEIQVLFSLAYARADGFGDEKVGFDCEYKYQIITGGLNNKELSLNVQRSILEILDGSSPAFAKQIATLVNTQYPFLGVEKNPKQIVFSGFRAEVSSKNTIFTPFIEDPVYQAESFAKPFGGQIGPYYSKNDYGVYYESGVEEKTDPLGPRRVSSDDQNSYQLTEAEREQSLANHSKYPGDKLGLTSYASYLSMDLFAPAPIKFHIKDYAAAAYFSNPDPIVCNHYDIKEETKSDQICGANEYQDQKKLYFPRKMEIIAVAPDLFDITYYSIENDFKNNYFKKVKRIADMYIDEKVPLADLGSSYVGTLNNLTINETNHWTIRDQVELVKSSTDIFGAHSEASKFYKVQNPEQILTSWVNFVAPYKTPLNVFPGTVEDLYSVKQKKLQHSNASSFQKCYYPARSITARIANIKKKEIASNPGDCIVGGRSGYSVKIFHKTIYPLSQWLPSY